MKLVVVGGVAAGASVAARARRLDEFAEIVVFEKSHHVSFANCGLPYHIGEVITERSRLLLQTPQSLRESLNIDVRIATEVTHLDRENKTVSVRNLDTGEEYVEKYDKLVLAMGASALRPPLPGLDLPNIHVLRRIGDMDEIKAKLDEGLAEIKAGKRKDYRTVVVGAGYIGLEMAENLRHRGAIVDVVERADQILPPLDKEMSVSVENHCRVRGISLHLSTGVAAFQAQPDGRMKVELTSNEFLDADLVIMAAGVRPRTKLAIEAGIDLGERGGIKVDTHMRTNDPDIYAAGDIVETPHTVLPGSWLAPLAGPANRQARVVAENICGRETEYKSTQGTSIVKVFDMVAGGTGATERQLEQLNVPHRAVHVHPNGHAGYYPGTAMLHLKVLFDPTTGQLLGGQAAGFDGVDKRLDVLAAAIRAKLTVFDLEEFELAYAPPFGSAKDPVNMAGFVGANTIRGDLKLWYAQDYPANTEGARIIDVRTPEEYAIWHIPGAENIPLATVRSVCESWDKSIPVRLYCAVGFRSYLANRILVQRGFADVATLSGGSTTFKFWYDVNHEEVPAPMVNYAEKESLTATSPSSSGVVVDLDCTGLACPGPIMKLSSTMASLNSGDEIIITVSDAGFGNDAPAWAKKNGHQVLELTPVGSGYKAIIRKGGIGQLSNRPSAPAKTKNSFVVFSGDLDKQIAAFIIANGALAMGEEVSMFFTFWGLNSLRKQQPPKRKRKAMDKMFAAMMPSGADDLKLSQMHMFGAGTNMIKKVMKNEGVPSLQELMQTAIDGGARIVACTMTMDLLGIAESDMIEGVEYGGVATFLGDAAESQTSLFI
jgi:NADPH-dependent 2,4-dienoyl-CoA reductase/sulfur reductase-like enzyme/peroxiredoxin family protein/TusA-related sulfurtransferase/rhodanese-related sulfurtransferase